MRLPKSAHSTSRPEHPASHFVEQPSMRARLGDDSVWKRFLRAASARPATVSAPPCSSSMRGMVTSCGRSGSTERSKTSSRSRMKLPAVSLTLWVCRSPSARSAVSLKRRRRTWRHTSFIFVHESYSNSGRQSIQLARQMFERAIELDPNFAAAWAGLATAHVYLFSWGGRDPDLQKAHNASTRALELDPELADAHVAAGQSFSMEERHGEAAAEFERAIELDTTLFDAYYYYARSCFKAGDLKKALKLFEKAQSVRPEDYQSAALIAAVLRQLGRSDDAQRAEQLAIESINRHLELHAEEARALSLGAIILARLGEVKRSKQWNERAMSLAPDDDAILYNASCVFAVLGEEDQALAGLQRAIEAGLAGGDWVSQDPDWERLRDHPRFQALVQRLRRS